MNMTHPDDNVTWADERLDDEVYLFNLYANHVYESFEDFVMRMYANYGDNWIAILKRKR